MTHRLLIGLTAILLIVGAAGTSQALPILVVDGSQFNSDDFVDWKVIDGYSVFNDINTPADESATTVASNSGALDVTVSVNNYNNGFETRVNGAGDSYLVEYYSGLWRLDFSQPVFGAGAILTNSSQTSPQNWELHVFAYDTDGAMIGNFFYNNPDHNPIDGLFFGIMDDQPSLASMIFYTDGWWPSGQELNTLELISSDPAPEPTTLVLLGVGLLGGVCLGRKKRKPLALN